MYPDSAVIMDEVKVLGGNEKVIGLKGLAEFRDQPSTKYTDWE